ncbi:MAG: aminotransferase class III-fold pyridoxal phosphate-dependent enzyme [Pseudoclavibacter sp.]|nr:aminotransferase class III-fold pyridoxal phosphate-dependent enzyme [Pseudoclavibacter sp.]
MSVPSDRPSGNDRPAPSGGRPGREAFGGRFSGAVTGGVPIRVREPILFDADAAAPADPPAAQAPPQQALRPPAAPWGPLPAGPGRQGPERSAPAEPTIPFPGEATGSAPQAAPPSRRRARRLPDEQELRERVSGLAARRERVLAPVYRLRSPGEPLEFVRGEGAYLYDARGRQYLDAEGGAAVVGHSNPLVRERVRTALDRVSIHTGHVDEQLVSYAERLVHMFPHELDRVLFACSGSEAVDLSLRIVRYRTRRRGVLCTSGANHGITSACASISPALGDRSAVDDAVVAVPAPDGLREDPATVGRAFAQRVRAGIAELGRRGHAFAGLICDPVFFSDGVQADPPGFLQEARQAVREAGGLWISDEAQAGFGRIGSHWWGYQRHGLDPDLVVLGRGMANSLPAAAVVGRADLFERFGAEVPYFSGMGGGTASIAAATAVLDVLKGDALRELTRRAGRVLAGGLVEIAEAHERIAQVRGAGLVLGLQIAGGRGGSASPARTAEALVRAMRRRGVLLSLTGPERDVVAIRPPLVCTEQDMAMLLEAFEDALVELRGDR